MKHQIVTGFWLFLLLPATSFSVDLEFSGWKPFSPRDEIRPNFAVEESGGPDGSGGLVILHDDQSVANITPFLVSGRRLKDSCRKRVSLMP